MNHEQQAQVIDLVAAQPWADLDAAIVGMELSLRLAPDATLR